MVLMLMAIRHGYLLQVHTANRALTGFVIGFVTFAMHGALVFSRLFFRCFYCLGFCLGFGFVVSAVTGCKSYAAGK